jgi:transcriptional regulator with XRE-family HTH domain
MENLTERQKQALRLIEKIVELDPDEGTRAYALKMREHLRLPMSIVLEKLWPELTVMEKVKRLGINRSAYYKWLSGRSRPATKLARKLAALTGFDADEIRGRVSSHD